MSFADLGLSPEILQSIHDAGYTDPTPIQAQAIPYVLMGRDVLGIAQTGTGKTASFTLPMIDILAKGRAKARMPRTLILAPTRELASQVSNNFTTYGKNHKLTMALLIGGESMGEQQKLLDRGVDVLIATPGRLLDLFDRGSILLRDVKVLVIDEADRMLDMGFIPDVERIVSLLPPIRQTLFFSATMDDEIRRLADAFLMNPREVRVAAASKAADTVTQGLVTVQAFDKREALRHLLRRETITNAFIFCNRKRDVDILHRSLVKHGFDAVAMHGDMPQYVRTERLEKFKAGEVKLMVCSDVAARGIDISDVSAVFNFDVPTHAEDYVHRIGRTGRAGKTGLAYTIATPDDGKYVAAVEKLLGQKIPPVHLEELEEVSMEAAEEATTEQRGRRRSNRRNERGSRSNSSGAEARTDRPREDARASGDRPSGDREDARRSADRNARGDRNDRGDRSDRGDRNDRNDRNDRGDRNDRRRNKRRWNDPQSEVQEMDVAEDAIGFGGFTPAFLLEETAVPLADALDDGDDDDTDDVTAPVEAAVPVPEKPKRTPRKRTPRKKAADTVPADETSAEGQQADDAPVAVAPSEDETPADTDVVEAPVAEVLVEVSAEGPAVEMQAEPVAEPAAEGEAAETPVEAVTEPVAEVEAGVEPAPEEKPKRRRTTRKKAEPAATEEGAEAATEEKPKPKRATRSRKKAEPAAMEEGAEAATEEKPKPKRATRSRKKAEPAATEEGAEAATEEKPKPKRATRSRKKVMDPEPVAEVGQAEPASEVVEAEPVAPTEAESGDE